MFMALFVKKMLYTGIGNPLELLAHPVYSSELPGLFRYTKWTYPSHAHRMVGDTTLHFRNLVIVVHYTYPATVIDHVME